MDGADGVARFAIWYVVFLLSLTLHEAGHALVAWLGGDDTAYRGGQVSLNPVPHMRREPFGTILFPLITYVSSGWMMGWASSPYDPCWGQAHPRRMAAMSAAGPAGNLLIASIAFIALK
ncbi:MAG TPA: site-2 protease family protein, partial [Candidatus Polarisedimenticolia bacterium]